MPEDVYKDEDNEMGRLGVAFDRLVQGFSFAEMRASNSHWAGENSAELDALRRGSAYKYQEKVDEDDIPDLEPATGPEIQRVMIDMELQAGEGQLHLSSPARPNQTSQLAEPG